MIINETENCIREDTRNPRRERRGRGQLINNGMAYVDEQSTEEIKKTKGSFTEAGTNSP